MQSRRDALLTLNVIKSYHAGLWIDKYLSKQLPKGDAVNEETPYQQLVKEVTTIIEEPPSYDPFFKRWQAGLELAGAHTREAEVQGRLAVGLGAESVIETAITLHRTYGVPYIPGSALKGLAAAFARQRLSNWDKGSRAYQTMFGTTDSAGFMTFYDALYIPGSGKQGQALYPDVITVHHQSYYQNQNVAPADWDNPNPVSFLSATGRYLVALAGPDEAWLEAAFDILGSALSEVGVGAKTSSGYGRLRLLAPPPPPAVAVKAVVVAIEENRVIVKMPNGEEASLVGKKMAPKRQPGEDLSYRFLMGETIQVWEGERNKRGNLQVTMIPPDKKS